MRRFSNEKDGISFLFHRQLKFFANSVWRIAIPGPFALKHIHIPSSVEDIGQHCLFPVRFPLIFLLQDQNYVSFHFRMELAKSDSIAPRFTPPALWTIGRAALGGFIFRSETLLAIFDDRYQADSGGSYFQSKGVTDLALDRGGEEFFRHFPG
jgi:hypothetical protein